MAQAVLGSGGNFDFTFNERANLSIVFPAGLTGRVNLFRFMNGDWRPVAGAQWTASTEDIIYSGADGTRHRLNASVSVLGGNRGILVEVT